MKAERSMVLGAILQSREDLKQREMRLREGWFDGKALCRWRDSKHPWGLWPRNAKERLRNSGLAAALGSLDVLLDLHISFSVWLAAELCYRVQVLCASAVTCIWTGELWARESAAPQTCQRTVTGTWVCGRRGCHWARCGTSVVTSPKGNGACCRGNAREIQWAYLYSHCIAGLNVETIRQWSSLLLERETGPEIMHRFRATSSGSHPH